MTKFDRRQFLRALAALGAASAAPFSSAWAMGEDDDFTIATLEYSGGKWNPRPTALRRLLLEVEKRTSIEVDASAPSVAPTSKKLFEHPFVVLAGDRKFGRLGDEEVKKLRTFLQSGGFLLVDSAEGLADGPFMKSVERELGRILPDKKLGTLPDKHVLYKSFYLIDEPTGRVEASSKLRAIFDDDRLSVVVSPNDLLGALARDSFGNWEYEVTPGGERQREMAFRLGINLVMYALCTNYKSDQVHIPFILRRRQWKVD